MFRLISMSDEVCNKVYARFHRLQACSICFGSAKMQNRDILFPRNWETVFAARHTSCAHYVKSTSMDNQFVTFALGMRIGKMTLSGCPMTCANG